MLDSSYCLQCAVSYQGLDKCAIGARNHDATASKLAWRNTCQTGEMWFIHNFILTLNASSQSLTYEVYDGESQRPIESHLSDYCIVHSAVGQGVLKPLHHLVCACGLGRTQLTAIERDMLSPTAPACIADIGAFTLL